MRFHTATARISIIKRDFRLSDRRTSVFRVYSSQVGQRRRDVNANKEASLFPPWNNIGLSARSLGALKQYFHKGVCPSRRNPESGAYTIPVFLSHNTTASRRSCLDAPRRPVTDISPDRSARWKRSKSRAAAADSQLIREISESRDVSFTQL